MTPIPAKLWYLPPSRVPVPAGQHRRPPAGITHWTREGMTEWRPIAELLAKEEAARG